MKVIGYEIEGTADFWANRIQGLLCREGDRPNFGLTRWAEQQSALAHVPIKGRLRVAHRLVDRALQKGRKMGMLEYDGKVWKAKTL
jgi:hypothetical protein